SLFTTANDLSRFLTALVSDGQLDGKRVLSHAALVSMMTPNMPEPGDTGRAYGYGLEVEKHGDLVALRHTGRRAGYGSIIALVPSKGFAFAAMGNRTGAILGRTAQKAAETYLPDLEPPSRVKEQDTAMTADDAKRFA